MLRMIGLVLVCGMAGLAPAAETVRVKNLKLLCVLYRGEPGGTDHMDEHAVLQARNGFELGRLFYFRNSRALLNCELHWLIFDEAPPETAGPTTDHIVAHLKEQGVKDGEWDGLVVTGVGLKGNFGGFTVLGGAGACFGIHGVRGGLAWYPEDNPDVAYGTAWIFVHEFQHALDLSICENSGRKDMLHDHPYADRNEPQFKGFYQGGEHFDWVALCLREFDGYLDIKGATSSFLECTDADGDGLPDDDPRLPMDEQRFGSDPAKKDTDNDGLHDLGEFTAGRYAGSDPNKVDTDGDGMGDGEDPYPLVAMSATLPYARLLTTHPHRVGSLPRLLDSVFVRNDEGGQVAVSAEWREDFLHFVFSGPRPFSVHAKIDGSAANGFWEGGDTYLLRIADGRVELSGLGLDAAVSGAVAKAMLSVRGYALDVIVPARLGQGVSKEINYGGQREPQDVVDGLTLVAGRSIAFNFIFEFKDGARAVLTPHHTMYATRLVKPADAPQLAVLRGPAETNAAIATVDVLGVRQTSRVDVVTEDGRVVGRRIGPGPVHLVGLEADGTYTLSASTAEAKTTPSTSGPHKLRVDRTAAPPKLSADDATLTAQCEPNAEFELWWGLDGVPVAALGGARADEQGLLSLPLGEDLARGWVVTGYRGSRFDERVFVESWDEIDRNFEGRAPDPRLPGDHFSYRFEGLWQIDRAGRYTLELSSDDGSRLWIDRELVINHWGQHGLSPKSATLELTEGLHRVRLDYYELDGWAGIKLRWAPAGEELITDLPVRRMPLRIAEVELFGVQTDQLGNRSGCGGVSNKPGGRKGR